MRGTGRFSAPGMALADNIDFRSLGKEAFRVDIQRAERRPGYRAPDLRLAHIVAIVEGHPRGAWHRLCSLELF